MNLSHSTAHIYTFDHRSTTSGQASSSNSSIEYNEKYYKSGQVMIICSNHRIGTMTCLNIKHRQADRCIQIQMKTTKLALNADFNINTIFGNVDQRHNR